MKDGAGRWLNLKLDFRMGRALRWKENVSYDMVDD